MADTPEPAEPGLFSLDSAIPKLMAAEPEDLPALFAQYLVPEQQQAFITAGVWSRKLMAKAPYKSLLATMISARQLYAVCYTELQALVGAESPPADPMTEDMLVQSAMHEAAKPFELNEFINGLLNTAMPWLGDLADAKNKQEADEVRTAAREYDEARRVLPLQVGFRVDPEWEEPSVPRDRSLVLAGWRPAVVFVIDQIVNSVLASRVKGLLPTVVRLQRHQPRRGDHNIHLVRLGEKQWEGCCNTTTALPRMAAQFVAPQMTYPADMIVCDDLLKAHNSSYRGRPAGAVAGDSHKRLRDWAKPEGAGVVAGVQFAEQGDVDISGPEWEQLRTFTTVRPVRVIAEAENLDPGKYRVLVGRGVHYWDVDKSVLDGYDTASNLIISGAKHESDDDQTPGGLSDPADGSGGQILS